MVLTRRVGTASRRSMLESAPLLSGACDAALQSTETLVEALAAGVLTAASTETLLCLSHLGPHAKLSRISITFWEAQISDLLDELQRQVQLRMPHSARYWPCATEEPIWYAMPLHPNHSHPRRNSPQGLTRESTLLLGSLALRQSASPECGTGCQTTGRCALARPLRSPHAPSRPPARPCPAAFPLRRLLLLLTPLPWKQ